MSKVLINSIITMAGMVFPGTAVDAADEANAVLAGGLLADAADPYIAAAVLIVSGMRQHGASPENMTTIMTNAYNRMQDAYDVTQDAATVDIPEYAAFVSFQPALGATVDGLNTIVIAPTNKALKVTSIYYMPEEAGLTASDTVFRTLTIAEYDATGTIVGSSIIVPTTKTLAAMVPGTGNWVQGVPVPIYALTAGYALAAGHCIRCTWTHASTGTAVPYGRFFGSTK